LTWEFNALTASEGFAYAEIKELLENEHLKQDQGINPLAPTLLPALCYIALIEKVGQNDFPHAGIEFRKSLENRLLPP